MNLRFMGGLAVSAGLALMAPTSALADGEFSYPAGGTLGVATGTSIEIDGGSDCVAARAGTVTYADTQDGSNYTVILQHESGYETFYEQLNFDTLAVNQGDQLNAGDEVGQSNATAFEIHRYGAPQFVPGNIGDSVNQGDPILATYPGLNGGTNDFDTIVLNARSAWMGDLGTLTINSDGSWSMTIRPTPVPGRPTPMFIMLKKGNLTASELASLDQAFETIAADQASLDGTLPGIVADGTSFTIDATVAGTQHELKGFFGANRSGAWDPGVSALVSTLNSILTEVRFPKPAPASAFTTIVLSTHSAWMGDLGTLTINGDGSYTFVSKKKGTVNGNLTATELSTLNQAFQTVSSDGASLDGALPGFIADGTTFKIDTTVSGAQHELTGFFGGYNNASSGGWDAGVQSLVDTLSSILNENLK